jgi:hypothetical protein
MRKEEFTRIKSFVEAGDGYGDKRIKDIAEGFWREALLVLASRRVLQEEYRTQWRKAITHVLKKRGYEDRYYGYVPHFLGRIIEDPGFDGDASFSDVVRNAAERAYAAIYTEAADFLHVFFNRIGSDLEKTPH